MKRHKACVHASAMRFDAEAPSIFRAKLREKIGKQGGRNSGVKVGQRFIAERVKASADALLEESGLG